MNASQSALKARYDAHDYQGIIDIGSGLLREKGRAANAKMIMGLLHEAEVPKQWSALATILGEARINTAVPALLDKAKEARTANFRGAILGALMELDCRAFIGNFIEMALIDNWEISLRAAYVIENCLEDGLSDEQFFLARSRLIDIDDKIPDERKGDPADSDEFGMWRDNYRWLVECFL